MSATSFKKHNMEVEANGASDEAVVVTENPDEVVRFKLTVPIRSGEGTGKISELVLNRPNGEVCMDLGNPYRIKHFEDGSVSQDPNMAVLGHYISRLAAIPMSSVKSMDPWDFVQATQIVLGFFLPRKTPKT